MPTLSPYHALYGNVTRGLTSDPLAPRMVDSISGGTEHLAAQATPSVLTLSQNTAVTPTQGVAEDGSYWYEIDTAEIRRSEFSSGNVTHTNSSPYSSLTAGIDHLGDGCLVGSLLCVPAIDWDGGTQTSTSQTLAFFDSSDLTYDSQFDISGSSDCNASAVCVGHTGNLFVTSYYNGAGPDDRLRDIYEFNVSTGAYVATHTADADLTGIQGIDYDAANGLYIVSTYDASANNRIITLDESMSVLYTHTVRGYSDGIDELEGVHYSGDRTWYTHKLGGGIRRFDPGGLHIDPVTGTPPLFLDSADVPDEGSIVLRGTPGSLFNFNTLWDNNTHSNHWECWIYSDGRVGARINSASSCVSSVGAAAAGTEIIIGFSWLKTSTTVAYELNINGTTVASVGSATWIAAPASGLYLGGKNAGNTLANFQYRDVIVWDKRLTSGEWSTLAGDFDDVYNATTSFSPGFARSTVTIQPGVAA